jgi:hypothetical protein
MNDRMKKFTFPVMANMPGSPGDFVALFIHDREPFFGVKIIHLEVKIGIFLPPTLPIDRDRL